MQLKKIRITNFRCVEDSNEFTVGRVTCLVGKNESGKTAILEALYQLNPYDEDAGTYDKVRDYPRRFLLDYEERHRTHPAHVATTTWELDDSDRKAVADALGPSAFKRNEVSVSKGYDRTRYWDLEADERQAVKHLISTGSLHTEEAQKIKACKTVKDLKNRLKELGDQASEREKELLTKANTQFKRGTASLAAIDILEKRMPKILYFSEYDKMPGNVALEDMLRKENDGQLGSAEKVFLAFLELVGTSAKEISKIDKFEPLIARLEAASIKITREIFEYWSQNRHLKVEFRLDAGRPGDPPPFNSGQIMRTRIKNMHHDVTVNFDDRSSGFVWFFLSLSCSRRLRKTMATSLFFSTNRRWASMRKRRRTCCAISMKNSNRTIK